MHANWPACTSIHQSYEVKHCFGSPAHRLHHASDPMCWVSKGPLTIAGDVLYGTGDAFEATEPPCLFALNATTGEIINQVSLGQLTFTISGPAIVDDVLYIGTGSHPRWHSCCIQLCMTCCPKIPLE